MAETAAGAHLDVRLHTHLSGDHADDGYCMSPTVAVLRNGSRRSAG
jgi:hypothetical protein